MYGHTENDYTANSAFGKANQAAATQLGLINWNVDTWTIRPALDLQYQYTWHRVIFTFSSDLTYYYTESSAAPRRTLTSTVIPKAWISKVDVDVPLGVELFGHDSARRFLQLYELYDGLREGLNTDNINEAHGRIVMDFLDQLWKVQIHRHRRSYLWSDNFDGWSIGADVAFRF